MQKFAFLLALSIVNVPVSASSGEACVGGMLQKSPHHPHEGREPSCPPAQCTYVCVAIPASSKKTGETISVYPDPSKWFNYEFIEKGVSEGTQQYCYKLKNWSDVSDRSYSLCIQYQYE